MNSIVKRCHVPCRVFLTVVGRLSYKCGGYSTILELICCVYTVNSRARPQVAPAVLRLCLCAQNK